MKRPRIAPANPDAHIALPGSREGGVFAQQMQAWGERFWMARWKQCPYCAERIRREAVVCRYCQHELPNG